MALLLVLGPAAAQAVPIQSARHAEPTRLQLKTLDWDTARGLPPEPIQGLLSEAAAEAAGYWFVQASPERYRELRALVRAAGGRTFDYLPNNAFEAWLPAGRAGSLRSEALAFLPVHPAWKVDPALGAYGSGSEDPLGRLLVAVELWPDRDLLDEAERFLEVDAEPLEILDGGRYLRALVRIPPARVLDLARHPGVKWLQESPRGDFRNDKSRWVIQTNRWRDLKLWQHGVTGRDVTIGHIDGVIWESSCYFDDPTGVPPGPLHRKIKWTSGSSGGDPHGTHTAGSAAGNSIPVNGSDRWIGMAPDAWLVHHTGIPSGAALLATLTEANTHGARLHTNSWGNDFTTDYDFWSRDIDAYAHDNEDAMVAFAVTNGQSVKNPENAKSAVGVGATEKSDPEMHGSGGKGPTADGRIKPEVYAPGCGTRSAAAGANCLTVTDCGTSMACPVVVGGAALLKQYFEDGFWPTGAAVPADGFTPSGSLLRACLANSAQDMSGVPGYPSWREGWGRILLDNVAYFAGDLRRLKVVDVPHASGLVDGASHTYSTLVPNGSNMRITLAWADEPGAAFAADPVVNDLDLVVTAPNGTVFHGNILDLNRNGASRPNPWGHDSKNTLEMVLAAAPTPGLWTVQVVGRDVPAGPQGYAVVMTY